MIYQLLEFYKKELSIYNRVFRHMKFWYLIFILSPFISGIMVIFLSVQNNKFYGNLFLASIIITPFIASIPFNCIAKKTVKQLYDVSSNEYMWNSYEVINKLRQDSKEKLYEYVQKVDKETDKADIERLSQIALKEAENFQIKFPIIPSIFAALFISLWNNFINWIYENIELFDDAFRIFAFFSILLALLAGVLIMIKSFLNIIIKDIINKDFSTMKNLSELLGEISEDMEKEKNRSY